MSSTPGYPLRVAFLTLAVLAVAGIVFQVYLVGLSLLVGQPSWDTHVGLGHMLGLFPLLMIVVAYVGRFPSHEKQLTWLFLVIFILQAEIFAAVRDAVPLYATWHPVLALALFATGSLIVWRAYALVRMPAAVRTVTELPSEGSEERAA